MMVIYDSICRLSRLYFGAERVRWMWFNLECDVFDWVDVNTRDETGYLFFGRRDDIPLVVRVIAGGGGYQIVYDPLSGGWLS
jgi:hypothetical protein